MQQKNHKTNRHYWMEEKKTQIKYSIMFFKCSFKLKPPKNFNETISACEIDFE